MSCEKEKASHFYPQDEHQDLVCILGRVTSFSYHIYYFEGWFQAWRFSWRFWVHERIWLTNEDGCEPQALKKNLEIDQLGIKAPSVAVTGALESSHFAFKLPAVRSVLLCPCPCLWGLEVTRAHTPAKRTKREGFISDWSSRKVTLTKAAKERVVPDSVRSRCLILHREEPCHGSQINARDVHSSWQSSSRKFLPETFSSLSFSFIFSLSSFFPLPLSPSLPSSLPPFLLPSFLPVVLDMEPTALYIRSKCSAITLQSQPGKSLNDYSGFTLKTMSLFVEFVENLGSLQLVLQSPGGELWEERSHSPQQPPHVDLWNK